MKLLLCVVFMASVAGLSPVARAQLAVYSFTGNSANATTTGAHVIASSFTGSNAATLSNSSPVYSAGSGSYAIGQNTWTGSAPGTNYFEFTLTPAAGYSITLSSISFGSRSTTTGPTNYSIRSSLDSYTSNSKTGSLLNDSNWSSSGTQSISLTFLSATTFRFYATGASSAGGTLRIDDFTLNGTVSAIPEPSTYAAILGGVILIGVIQSKRRNLSAKRAS